MSIKIGFRFVEGAAAKACAAAGMAMLIPATELDAEEMRKLDPKATYTSEFRKMRNYEYHKRYFAMLQVVLEHMRPEVKDQKGIRTIENLLLVVKLELGHCDFMWLDTYQQMVLTPKSISFSAMDEFEFRKFYSDTLDLCLGWFPGSNLDQQNYWRSYVDEAVMKLIGFM